MDLKKVAIDLLILFVLNCFSCVKKKLTGCAVVDVDLTVVSSVARLTIAHVAPLAVYATASIFAGVFLAFVHILIAAWSCSV